MLNFYLDNKSKRDYNKQGHIMASVSFKRITAIFCVLIGGHLPAFGTAWTDAAGDSSWSNPANWTSGVPTTSSNVFVNDQSNTGLLGVDTGIIVNVINSLTFNASLTGPIDVLPLGVETLQIDGPITNNDDNEHKFSLPVFPGASTTWNGGSAGINFANNVTIETYQITLVGTLNFTGTNLNFSITDATNYGRFLGSGTANVTGVTINIFGPYTGVLGDVFDFTTGNFTGATLGLLPTLSSGLSWDTSAFISTGVLTVVPEPQTFALFAFGLGALVIMRRCRKSA